MSLSECTKCGGHIQLGPDAANVCEKCGAGVFALPDSADTDDDEAFSEIDRMRAENERLRALICEAVAVLTYYASDKYDQQLVERLIECITPGQASNA